VLAAIKALHEQNCARNGALKSCKEVSENKSEKALGGIQALLQKELNE